MIVKVMRPLIGSPPPDGLPIVVYDKRRQHQDFFAQEDLPDWLNEALETSPKVFAEAHRARNRFRFDHLEKWQSW